jgi:hypothetical protein
MKLIVIIITTFFAILGGLALLNELLEHIAKPKSWTRINRGRRAFVIIVLSMITTPIVAAYSRLRREKTARALSILRELEIRLTQIDSVLQNIIVTNASGAPVDFLNRLAEYLAVYGARAGHPSDGLTANWASALGKEMGERVESQIHGVYSQILHWSSLGEEKFQQDNLVHLARSISTAKVLIAELINEYMSD